MRISDWSSDVCSSDLSKAIPLTAAPLPPGAEFIFKLLLIFLAIFVIVSVKLGHLVIPPCLVIGIVIAVMFPIIARLTAGGETAALVGKGAINRGTPSIARSEERRVGQECVSTCRSRGSPSH